MNEASLKNLLLEVGAIRRGHFLLTSGRHAAIFFQMARLFEWPDLTAEVVAYLLGQVDAPAPTVVVGPAMGGVILAYEMARQLKARSVYAEKDSAGGMRFRRGFVIEPGERVWAVEDAFTTGKSVGASIEAVTACDAVVERAIVLIRRSLRPTPFSVPMTAGTTWEVPDYAPADCPQCRAGTALIQPKEVG